MNYEKIYHNIINNRLNNPIINEYTECHHILPKSLGGSDDKSNLVNLLAREHFICHLLLTKMYKEGTLEWIKMIKAFEYMYSYSPDHQRYSDNKWYEYLKINFSKAQSINQSDKGNSQYKTIWICNYEQRINKKIKDIELQKYLDEGWIKKRIINWNNLRLINGEYKIFSNKRLEQYLQTRKNEEKNKIYYEKLYEIYLKYGYDGVVKEGYKYSFPNLVQCFKAYIPNFTTQQGIARNNDKFEKGLYNGLSLNDLDKKIIDMKDNQNMTFKEISKILGMHRNTILRHYYRYKNNL